jgi:Glycosyl transferase family 21
VRVAAEPATPTLAVVVPATDRPPTLDACLEAIRRSSAPPEELIVITEPAGAGPAAARNAGAAAAAADIIAFVDADLTVHRDALARIRAAFARDPSLAAVFGSYDDSPAAPGVVSRFRNLLHHHVHQQAAGPAETFWAGLGAIRREAFRDAGGFDERRFRNASIEDVELGMRLAAQGARMRLDPTITGTHLKRWTLVGMVRTDFADRGVPWVGLLVRSRALPRHLNLGWRHRLSMAASLIALGGVLWRRPRVSVAGLSALVALNGSLYALVARRLGPGGAVLGVGIHALHHVVAAAAIPVGMAKAMLNAGVSAQPVPVHEASASLPQRDGADLVSDRRGGDRADEPGQSGVQPIGAG